MSSYIFKGKNVCGFDFLKRLNHPHPLSRNKPHIHMMFSHGCVNYIIARFWMLNCSNSWLEKWAVTVFWLCTAELSITYFPTVDYSLCLHIPLIVLLQRKNDLKCRENMRFKCLNTLMKMVSGSYFPALYTFLDCDGCYWTSCRFVHNKTACDCYRPIWMWGEMTWVICANFTDTKDKMCHNKLDN